MCEHKNTSYKKIGKLSGEAVKNKPSTEIGRLEKENMSFLHVHCFYQMEREKKAGGGV